MAVSRREKGTGSWDTVTKKGVVYQRYRKKYEGMSSRKEFTGRTKADVNAISSIIIASLCNFH